jgi:Na+-transporting NADH:ubiquinone oxidoreductase subunit NqrF
MTDTYNIRIQPHERKITAKKGRSLMESLVDHSIFLRSDCGGKGSCGKCQVETIGGNGDHKSVTSCN